MFYALDLKPLEVKGDVEPAVIVFLFISAGKIFMIWMRSANERDTQRRVCREPAVLCRTHLSWLRGDKTDAKARDSVLWPIESPDFLCFKHMCNLVNEIFWILLLCAVVQLSFVIFTVLKWRCTVKIPCGPCIWRASFSRSPADSKAQFG